MRAFIGTLICCIGLWGQIKSYAQYQNVWAFGSNAGVDFNKRDSNGYPSPILTNIYSGEGVATMCNEKGELMFYTDGSIIYDKNNDTFPNGIIFYPSISGSTTQGTIIVPVSATRYFVFSLSAQEVSTPNCNGMLYYSVVNMDLNNGLGDVEGNKKGIFIDSNITEQLTNVVGRDCKSWIVCGKYKGLKGCGQFDRYNIAFYQIFEDSISSKPVMNEIEEKYYSAGSNFNAGSLVVSHDFKYLVSASFAGTVIFKLDPNEGRVYEPIKIDRTKDSYGACFSPDNTKLYVSMPGVFRQVAQFDISNYDENAINQSYYRLNDSSATHAGMQLGPDNKIYIATSSFFLHVIDNPNGNKASCNYKPKQIRLMRSHHLGLPNMFKKNYSCEPGKLYDSCYFQNNIVGGYRNLQGAKYRWNTGDTTASILVDTPGLYIVNYQFDWYETQDTFSVRRTHKLHLGAQKNSGDCFSGRASKYYLERSPGDRNSYSSYWIKDKKDTVNINTDTIEVVFSGQYEVVVELNGCVEVFPFQVDPPKFNASVFSGYNCRNDPDRAWATLTIPDGEDGRYTLIWMNQQWDTLSQKDTLFHIKDGIYYLKVQTLYCDTLISFKVVTKGEVVDFKYDSLICQNQISTLENSSSSYYQEISWYKNDSFLSHQNQQIFGEVRAGQVAITLVAKGEICKDSVTKRIQIDSLFQGVFVAQPDSICAGEAIQFFPWVDQTATSLHWQLGQHLFTADQPEAISHAFEDAGVFPITLRTTYRACPESNDTQLIYVYAPPEVYLGNDSTLCFQGQFIQLKNLRQQPDGAYQYLWSTGDTSEQLRVVSPGNYSLKVQTRPLGCASTESIAISKDCFLDVPNAFTPNADGVNDYFFPRKWLSNGIGTFHLQIFNRWGQLLFETIRKEGLGWDGKWNAVEQPMGVYIYRIDAVLHNGTAEYHEGNVTLMR